MGEATGASSRARHAWAGKVIANYVFNSDKFYLVYLANVGYIHVARIIVSNLFPQPWKRARANGTIGTGKPFLKLCEN